MKILLQHFNAYMKKISVLI